MDFGVRGALRVFLVAAGVGYVVWGAVDNRTTFVLLGLLAAAVGLFGLYREGIGPGTGQ